MSAAACRKCSGISWRRRVSMARIGIASSFGEPPELVELAVRDRLLEPVVAELAPARGRRRARPRTSTRRPRPASAGSPAPRPRAPPGTAECRSSSPSQNWTLKPRIALGTCGAAPPRRPARASARSCGRSRSTARGRGRGRGARRSAARSSCRAGPRARCRSRRRPRRSGCTCGGSCGAGPARSARCRAGHGR